MLPGASLTLSISQGYGRIGIQTTPGRYEIEQPQAEMNITQRPAELSINQGPGKLHVDSSDAWAALGSKSVFRMTHDIAQQAHQVALQAIQEKSEEGDQLSLPHPISIGKLAAQRYHRSPMPISDSEPGSFDAVRVSYAPTPTEVNVQTHPADIQVTPQKPVINYVRGDRNVYLDQKNWLNIDVKGTYMNQTF